MQDTSPPHLSPAAREARLVARPRPDQPPDAPRGLLPLGVGEHRDGLLLVPRRYAPDRAAPLVVVLHGAGGDARAALAPLRDAAERAGLVLLAIDSRGATWDVIAGAFGPDVAFLDAALAKVFERYAIDPRRVAIEGFSDGASYALTLGLANGDLFTDVVAFSPGFMVPPDRRGLPRVFVSHGADDRVLPTDRCGRAIASRLEREGYAVRYREFRGAHGVPRAVTAEAVRWLLASPAPAAT